MSQLDKHIEELQEKAAEIAEAKEDIYLMQSEITATALGGLMIKLHESIDELLEGISKKDSYDKDLGKTIKESIESVITEFAKQKAPNIEFKPQIKVDLQPLQAGQERLIKLIEKFNSNDKSDELYRLIVALISQQKIFLEKEIEQINYSQQLQSISEAIGKNDNILKELTVERHDNGMIKKVIPVYKTNTK